MKTGRKAIDILSRNPLILAMTAIMILPGSLVNLLWGGRVTVSNMMNPEKLISILGLYAVLMLVEAAVFILVLPPVLQLICDLSAGRPSQGWYLRGLRRLWWKPLVNYILLICAMSFFMAFFFALFMAFAIFSAVTSALNGLSAGAIAALAVPVVLFVAGFVSAAVVLYLTSLAAVTEEPSYGKALSMTMKLGTRHFFRILGAAAIAMGSMIVLTLLGMVMGPVTYGEPLCMETVMAVRWPLVLSGLWSAVPYGWLLCYMLTLYRRVSGPDSGK